MFIDEMHIMIIILIAIYTIIPCSSNFTNLSKGNDDMKITLKSDQPNFDRIIDLFFTIGNVDIIRVKILVSIDDNGNAINDDYNENKHEVNCLYYDVDEVKCIYLLYKIYYTMYSLDLRNSFTDKLQYHQEDEDVQQPTISLGFFREIFSPRKRSFDSIKSEMLRLCRASDIDIQIIINENMIYEYIIQLDEIQNAQRICIIHSAILYANNYRIIHDILIHLDRSGLMGKLDSIMVFNYGYELSTMFLSLYPTVKFFQVYHKGTYFELPTLRLLHRLSIYLSSERRLDTHVLYLHTKGASYENVLFEMEVWRNAMIYHLVYKSKNCYHLLQSEVIDTVGIYLTSEPFHHYQGNFWWSKASYLSKLTTLDYRYNGKMECEAWVLNNNGSFFDMEVENRLSVVVFLTSKLEIEFLHCTCRDAKPV